jgi:uncharacterized coiled-coil DUF342 family protein
MLTINQKNKIVHFIEQEDKSGLYEYINQVLEETELERSSIIQDLRQARTELSETVTRKTEELNQYYNEARKVTAQLESALTKIDELQLKIVELESSLENN